MKAKSNEDFWIEFVATNLRLGIKVTRVPLTNISIDTAISIAAGNGLVLTVMHDSYIFTQE